MKRAPVSISTLGFLVVTSVGCVATKPTMTPSPSNRSPKIDDSRAEIDLDKIGERESRSLDQPQEAAEFFRAQRLAPGQTELPLEHLKAELDAIRDRQAAQPRGAAPGGVSSWTWLGPGNIGGRTRALVINPQNPDIMYAAGVSGGIWKTTNAGTSWTPLDDMMLNLAVTTLVMDPTNPNVIYAGTGEGFGSASSFVRGLGIFKTTDAGATWNQLSGTVNGVPSGAFHYVNKLAVSPNDPNRLYAATRFGVWRSLDAGQTWSVRLANPTYTTGPHQSNGCGVGCTDLVVRSDRDPDVIFAAFGSFQRDGLYRSDDGGETWLAYTTGTNQGRMGLALAPSNNDVMYILMADNGAGGAVGQLVNVFRSVDGGASFQGRVAFDSLTGPWLLHNLILATGCITSSAPYAQGWYDNIIAVDPVDPEIVWVGGVDMFRSDDGGQNFGIAAYWIFYRDVPPPPYQLHPDHHTIVFHPDYDGVTNQTMYVGNDGGLFRTTNARAATSQEDCPLPGDDPYPEIVWERINNNYGVTQFYHGDAAKQIDRFTGGCQDNGTNQVSVVGTPNDWSMIFGGDGGYVAIDPTNPDIIYIEIQFFPTIYKSVNGGLTFLPRVNGITDTDGLFITPFAMDQNDPNVLWTGGTRPWRTTTGAGAWAPAGPYFAAPDRISAIAISPTDGNVVYLGFSNGFVAFTTNGLAASPTWTVRGFSAGLQTGAYISSMAVDPIDPGVAYATYSTYGASHILRSIDGGMTWTSIDGINATGVPDIPVHWVEPRPCNPDQLYAATELGVFASDDAGQTWQPANVGLANVVVESLDFKDEDTLIAFTHGRGAFVAHLAPGNPILGDFDGDGDVDAADFTIFSQCFGGSLNPPASGCPAGVNADLDGDGDVDVLDFIVFSQNFTGAL